MRRVGTLSDECPICGQTMYYGLWEHIRKCAQRKQQQADAQRAFEQGQRILDQLVAAQKGNKVK